MLWGGELRQIDHIRLVVEVQNGQCCAADGANCEPIAASHATDHHIGSSVENKVNVVLRSIVLH